MAIATNLGYPRIGAQRELKRAVEAYWAGELSGDELEERGRALREKHWKLQHEMGLDHIPSNDFSYYDQVLDTAAMVGAVPPRFGWSGKEVDLDTYFAMARGVQEKDADASVGADGAQALEMTKWFDTNYHYIVPEFYSDQEFHLASSKPVDAFLEARQRGIHTRPVLLGPVSFLLLGKARGEDLRPLDLLEHLLPVYAEVLQQLSEAGADWVQLDEPCLVLDLDERSRAAFQQTYKTLAEVVPGLDVLVATYFGGLEENLDTALHLPVAGLHLDLVRAPEQLEAALAEVPDGMSLSLGLIDGRNVWRADLARQLEKLEAAIDRLGPERVMVGPSCSLLHVPHDLEAEPNMDDAVRQWMAFARQKVGEINALAQATRGAGTEAEALFVASGKARESRRTSGRIHDDVVKDRLQAVNEDMLRRDHPYRARRPRQQDALDLPLLPTTTIGSFPQTSEVRSARAAFKRGDKSRVDYEQFLEGVIEDTIHRQEDIGLDVLVHGEPERSDMVEYFGQQMTGMLFTKNGWVQSYGSRCVRPPIIYGDVARPEPMTTQWITYAQSLTEKPVKGMLTGPVTILQWSFVRDDQPHSETCRQIALAIRDEVNDLEEAGIQAIQIDEPALREGLPLRRSAWEDYLTWAVECFRLASSGVADATQIHTHMCYAEFNDIIKAIAEMDADVISIESSRSKMELLDAFEAFDYPNEIGPGVYDIHSPRVPTQAEIEELLEKALRTLSVEQLWVNPDCGLKTRRWREVEPALRNMVQAAEAVRGRVAEPVG